MKLFWTKKGAYIEHPGDGVTECPRCFETCTINDLKNNDGFCCEECRKKNQQDLDDGWIDSGVDSW